MAELSEQKKRQKVLVGVLVIAVIVTLFLWYSNYQKGPSVISPEEQPTMGLLPVKELKLDLSVLDGDLFKSLKSHGLLPVVAGETGRENPFEPY